MLTHEFVFLILLSLLSFSLFEQVADPVLSVLGGMCVQIGEQTASKSFCPCFPKAQTLEVSGLAYRDKVSWPGEGGKLDIFVS